MSVDDAAFGFSVSTRPVVRHAPNRDVVDDVWDVELPHQCDAWVIGTGSRADAEAALTRFIAEAQDALDELRRAEPPCDHEWRSTGKRGHHNGGTEELHTCARCEQSVWVVVDRSTAADWYAQTYYSEDDHEH